MMMDKDISDLLQVSEIELFTCSAVSEAYKVVNDIEEELDDFMRRANNRFIGGGRYIPVGFDLSIGNVLHSTGQGYFSSYVKVNISIPYCKVNYGFGISEYEKDVYCQYNFSVFRYTIVRGENLSEVQRQLNDVFSNFADRDLSVKRPIGFTIQQVSSYMPQPTLQGFSSNYKYIGVVIYEEIYKDRFNFLNCTEQIQVVGKVPDFTICWKDGREIGPNFDEDIKRFPEDEGILFNKPMIIMYPGGGPIAQLIP